MFPEKKEAYEEEQRIKLFKKQNPGRDTHESKTPTPREFRELSSNKDFDDICRTHKACAIAFLPAIMTIDYEKDSFYEKLEILKQADEEAGRQASPVHYTWVNTTCHVSLSHSSLIEDNNF